LSLFSELKRRNVIRVAIGYVADAKPTFSTTLAESGLSNPA